MTTLKKILLLSKIENAITQNNFVLFFQYNNVTQKQWVLFKNLVSHLHVNLLVCKNSVTIKTHTSGCMQSMPQKINNSKQFIDTISLMGKVGLEKSKLIHCFCQGPTVIITTNWIDSCKIICDMLNVTGNAEKFATNNTIKSHQIINTLQKPAHSKLPAIFEKKKQFIDCINKNAMNTQIDESLCSIPTNVAPMHIVPKLFKAQKTNIIKNSGSIFTPTIKLTAGNSSCLKNLFFFVGGIAENQVMDILDIKKLCKLDDSIYTKMLNTLHTPITALVTLPTVVQTRFFNIFTAKHALLYVLNKKIQILQTA